MTTTMRTHLLPLAAVLVVAAGIVAACEEAESYVYTAQRFDAVADCLEPYSPVEVVSGPGAAATCEPACLMVGKDVFVSTMCPPLPAIATELEPDDEACVAALSVLGRTCGVEPSADGGADGSPDDDAAPGEDAGAVPNVPDAAPDAPTD